MGTTAISCPAIVAPLAERAGRQEQQDPQALLAVAQGLMARQRWSEAAAEFEKYAATRPQDWEASYLRGVAFASADGLRG